MNIFLYQETGNIVNVKNKNSGLFKRKEKKDEVEYIGAFKIYAGQRIYKMELQTKNISQLTLSTNRLLITDSCIYCAAINESVAKEKFKKMSLQSLNVLFNQ